MAHGSCLHSSKMSWLSLSRDSGVPTFNFNVVPTYFLLIMVLLFSIIVIGDSRKRDLTLKVCPSKKVLSVMWYLAWVFYSEFLLLSHVYIVLLQSIPSDESIYLEFTCRFLSIAWYHWQYANSMWQVMVREGASQLF